MAEISLVVTRAVLDHIAKGNENQSQIGMRSPSSEIKAIVSQLSNDNQRLIVLGGSIRLCVRDSGAIWFAHNFEYKDDFMSLFDLLSRRPGEEIRFICKIE